MSLAQTMLRSDFLYRLPERLIAQRPPRRRSDARLLQLRAAEDLVDSSIRDFPSVCRPGDLLVLNDTRVWPARLLGQRPTGGRVEFLVERLLGPKEALVQGRASKPLREGSTVRFGDTEVVVRGREDNLYRVEVVGETSLEQLMASHGKVPLPPYIRRSPDADDEERYQTTYARTAGAVAAPTAGLHFESELLEAVRAQGAELGFLTLHVGAGTFQPVREEDLALHHMHVERYWIPEDLRSRIEQTRRAGGRIIAVGTTVVRALESAAQQGDLAAGWGETRLFIQPGFAFQLVDVLLTNFHLPASSLLMLVCAFGGYERVMAAYRHAVEQRYRFFSYGDAMCLERAA